MPSHETLKLIISHWIMTLAFCGQTLFQKIRASYPVFENEGTGHQRVPPFSCLFSPWNNEMRLLGCPAAALAEGSEWSTAGKGVHTRIWGDPLVSGDFGHFWDAFGQEWLSWGAACTDGSQFQSQGYEREQEEGGKDAWTDLVCTHFYLHPELHNNCFEVWTV